MINNAEQLLLEVGVEINDINLKIALDYWIEVLSFG
jgi:hypothetical protein